jgi:hypothetical protein
MDTNHDPWGESAEEKGSTEKFYVKINNLENTDFGTTQGFADFGAFENSASFANFDSSANTSNTSNTSVEESDFCPPSCSSPSAEEMQNNQEAKETTKESEEDKDVKMEFESATKSKNDQIL